VRHTSLLSFAVGQHQGMADVLEWQLGRREAA
jgi:hypothetical protein